jgi:hypothetical protein
MGRSEPGGVSMSEAGLHSHELTTMRHVSCLVREGKGEGEGEVVEEEEEEEGIGVWWCMAGC